MTKHEVHFSSQTNEWSTPTKLFQKLDAEFGPFTLDVCATKESTKCPSFYGLDVGLDGLKADWYMNALPGPRAFCNPPYSKPENACKPSCKRKGCLKRGFHNDKYVPGQIDWVKKAVAEAAKGCTVVCLLPARTDTAIFHDYCLKRASKILFVEGRIVFNSDFGETDPAPFPSMLVIFEPKRTGLIVGGYEQ